MSSRSTFSNNDILFFKPGANTCPKPSLSQGADNSVGAFTNLTFGTDLGT